MNNFKYHIPTDIYFGKGQISNLADILNTYGKRVLLCYGGGSIKKIGLYDGVMKIMNENGFYVVECSGIEPNPRIESVKKGVDLCKEHNIDVVLAVGGGSTLDCCKAICAGRYVEGDLWQMVLNPSVIEKALPLVTILTLSATGSEMDNGGVISNLQEKVKKGFGSVHCFPKASICDPTYTFTVSPYQTSAGSADIMSHVMESYFQETMDCDIADGLAETILKSIIKNVPIALKEPTNYSARANLMWNSTIGINGMTSFGKGGGWSCHAMEHELSAFYDITHGVGLAILTPRWMRHILHKNPSEVVVKRFAKFARNVWGLEDSDELALCEKGIDALHQFFIDIKIPMTLKEVGIDEIHFEEMAEDAVKFGRLDTAPFVPLTKEDVVEIYRACL